MMKKVARVLESIVHGGIRRERILLLLLGNHYRSLFRRQWRWSDRPPHFENQRPFMFDFAFSRPPLFTGVYPFFRGFFGSEVVRDGDEVLDIGCGDGFFSMRFLSERALHVDAIDCDAEAIRTAQEQNAAGNVSYHLLDAMESPFPRKNYDVIVLDGALGHFRPETIKAMLRKIASHLKDDGVFVGSESLGIEGHDHLQYFNSLQSIRTILDQEFKYIYLRQLNYRLSWAGGFLRKEAFWRCSQNLERLDSVGWEGPFEHE
jgi:SAM-dependent methyltransferase